MRFRTMLGTGLTTAIIAASLGTAGSAAAAASAGYTESFVPVGPANPQSVFVNPVTDTVYAGESSTTGFELVAINGSNRAIEATIPLAADPIHIAVNSATNTLYVGAGSHILVIDGATNSLSGTIALPAGTATTGIAVDSATNMVYVASSDGSGAVVVIDGSSNTVTTTVGNVGNVLYIAVDEATDVIWVSADREGTVSAISGATDSIIHSVSVNAPLDLAVNPVTDRVYVTSTVGANSLTVIDGATGTITTTVPITSTSVGPVVVDPSADAIFARGSATIGGSAVGGLVVIDGATNTVADVVNDSGSGAAADPATGTVYVTSAPSKFPGIWAITPSASNAISPLLSGPVTEAGSYGVPVAASFTANGLPAPTITETGPLPAGVTLANGVLSGTPSAGSAGVYPITVTASNGVAPDYSIPFTLTIKPAASSPAIAVGVEGGGGEMYVQAPQLGSGWKPMGGRIVAPPAVAAAPNPDGTTPAQPLFIGTGGNHELFTRSLTVGWQPVGPVHEFCVGGAAAVITGGTLTVACRGTNNALWENTATVPSTGLPQFTKAWTSLGGGLAAGPAVAPVGGKITFFALGGGSRIYTRTLTTGWKITPWSCIAAPAAALQAVSGDTIFACLGATHVLWEAANGGAGWSTAVSLGGSLIGEPAVAATSGATELLAEGNNHAVWERTLTTGWVSLGGGVIGGVGAAALN